MKNNAAKAASISSHPLIIDKLTKARDISATSESFRVLIHQITIQLPYEHRLVDYLYQFLYNLATLIQLLFLHSPIQDMKIELNELIKQKNI